MQSEIKVLQRDVRKLSDGDARFKANDMLGLLKSYVEGTGPGGDLRKFSKPRLPLLLRLLIGKQTPVVTMIRERGSQMK